MDKILIQGGSELFGDVFISGAKNSVLPLLFSSLLTDQECSYQNVPDLKDVTTTLHLLQEFGATYRKSQDEIYVSALNLEKPFAPYDLVKTMRASVLALGPLLARRGRAQIALPGGCAIGARPINLHLNALAKMGAEITLNGGYVLAQAKKLKGASIYFETPTHTGTENIMMAAVCAEGTTIIENAAKDPEVIDLAHCLNKMGAHVEGAGTSKMIIEGKKKLNGVTHKVMFDRIEAGTYIAAVGATGGEVNIHNIDVQYMQLVLSKFCDAGVEIEEVSPNKIKVKSKKSLQPISIKTEPYPGFPTDLQAQMMSMATQVCGTSFITENIFENRFMHVCELERMGAKIKISGNMAIVEGGSALKGAPVMATDLRASVCLIIAGLVAQGKTEVSRVYHLDRGYERIEDKLTKLGAKIERIVAKKGKKLTSESDTVYK